MQQSQNLAAALQELDCGKGTIVGHIIENRLENPIILLGTMLTGAAITCYNPHHSIGEFLVITSIYGVL